MFVTLVHKFTAKHRPREHNVETVVQDYNAELLQCVQELTHQKTNIVNRITKEQAEQANLEREIARKADRLLQIRKRIDALNKVKYECDKALLETESTFVHVVQSSRDRLNNLRHGASNPDLLSAVDEAVRETVRRESEAVQGRQRAQTVAGVNLSNEEPHTPQAPAPKPALRTPGRTLSSDIREIPPWRNVEKKASFGDVEDVSFIPITRTASTSSYDKQPQKGYPRPSSPADLQDIQDLLSKSKPDEEVSQNGGKRLHPLRTPPAAPFSLQPLRPIPSKE